MDDACLKCAAPLPSETFFCPGCGAPRLADADAKTATTANYDPTSRDYKPWRETPPSLWTKPQLPPSITSTAKPSWRPPMTKQPLLPPFVTAPVLQPTAKAKVKKKKSKKEGKDEQATDTSNKGGLSSSTSLSLSGESAGRVRTPGIVYFKQLAFQRRGGRRIVPPDKVSQAKAAAVVTTSPSSSPKKGGRQEDVTLVHPLATYDASWLTVPGYTVHISLIDRSNGGDTSRYFLRVGTVFEHPNGTVDDLQVLEVLQNDIGRILTPPLQYWIDLNVINVDEYYMSNFLQQSLRFIAERVYKPSRYVNRLIDQILLVEALYETGGSSADDDDVDAAQSKSNSKRGNLIAVVTDQDVSAINANAEPDLALDKTIAQRACRVPIGPVYDARTVMSTVCLSILYPEPEALLHDPLPLKRDDILRRIPVKHIVLHVHPTYSESKIAPKIVSFEPLSLPVLIGEIDVDAVIEEGAQAVAKMLLKLCRLLAFRESTADGKVQIHLGITGAAILEGAAEQPGSRPSSSCQDGGERQLNDQENDNDNEEEEEEDSKNLARKNIEAELLARLMREKEEEAHLNLLVARSSSAVLIQSLFRKVIARVRVKSLLRCRKAAVPIQCFARRIIARYRVRRRRQQVAHALLEEHVRQQADGWTAALFEGPLCAAHNLHDCLCTHYPFKLGDKTCQLDFDLYALFECSDVDEIIVTALAKTSGFRAEVAVSSDDLQAVADGLSDDGLDFMLQTAKRKSDLLASLAEGLVLDVDNDGQPSTIHFDSCEIGVSI